LYVQFTRKKLEALECTQKVIPGIVLAARKAETL
jgi:hypothetical protein